MNRHRIMSVWNAICLGRRLAQANRGRVFVPSIRADGTRAVVIVGPRGGWKVKPVPVQESSSEGA